MGAKQELARLVRYVSGETLMVRSLDSVVRPRLERLSLRLPRGARVLDIGSKNSLYRSYFSHCIFQTVDIVRRHQPDIVADLHNLSAVVAEGTIDAIVCTEVLEHVRSPQVAIQQMRSSLKPGGTLIASTPFLVPYHPDPTDFWRITAGGMGAFDTRIYGRRDYLAWQPDYEPLVPSRNGLWDAASPSGCSGVYRI